MDHPSLFDNTGNSAIVDEWTFGQLQSRATAQSVLTNHWNTWITESDIQAIKAAGLNHIRIPIGYWAYDTSEGEAYHKGADVYLKKAVEWAGKAGLSVWIDLHGAPGSQVSLRFGGGSEWGGADEGLDFCRMGTRFKSELRPCSCH